MKYNNNGNGIAWTALVVSIVAIILGWTAFNRSGADLENIVEREVNEAVQEIQQEYQQAEDAFRRNASEGLDDAAEDISTDDEPNTAGE